MEPVQLTTATFDTALAATDRPLLVDFWASWCSPCRAMAPVVAELANEESARLSVAKLDVDASPEIAQRYQIMSIPTLILFKNGKPVTTIMGAQPKARLLDQLKGYLD
jgi:thioredoxin 1